MFQPSRPEDWGLGGHKPAELPAPDDQPFAGDPAPKWDEDTHVQVPPKPCCTVTCVTPALVKRPKLALVVRHGPEWIELLRCPVCSRKAVVKLAKPAQSCTECGGLGHVEHGSGERVPGAFREALSAIRDQLRVRKTGSEDR
jgi:hypothetical protein